MHLYRFASPSNSKLWMFHRGGEHIFLFLGTGQEGGYLSQGRLRAW